MKEPQALVAGTDHAADVLLEYTNMVIEDLAKAMLHQPKLIKYHYILQDVAEELKGQGINPHLLLDLESLTGFK